VSTEASEKRREPRYETRNAVTFSHLNKEEHYIGMARNISRCGMYFRSSRALKPGSCIVILPLDCRATDLLWGNGEQGRTAEAYCALDNRPDDAHRYFVHMVTAQVTRCDTLQVNDKLRFGVAVDYLRPTV
jgi:hypothetical protein